MDHAGDRVEDRPVRLLEIGVVRGRLGDLGPSVAGPSQGEAAEGRRAPERITQ